ncbi:MAG: hypothetical protein IPL52_06115 [Flavobacteriales bacterium]|nr:hypothetical protein [Flavobacteriales bacterium]
MRTLRSIGIALLLVGFLFKVMHWPGATMSLISGCLTIACSIALTFIRKGNSLSAGEVIRPIGGLLLLVTSLMHSLNVPGGTLAFYGSVLLVAATLLSDRTHIDLPRLSDLRAPVLLFAGLALVVGGFFFKAMHWPTAGIQIAVGLACGTIWTLLPKRSAPKEAVA